MSGAVQKVAQHLQKVHKMDSAAAAKTAKAKKRAPLGAVKMGITNPSARQMKSLLLMMADIEQPHPAKQSAKPPSSASFHVGGAFLSGFAAHLQTPAGESRSAASTAAVVAKYLYHLQPEEVREELLLKVEPVVPFLRELSHSGLGCSGILHCLAAHRLAIHYMELGVSEIICYLYSVM